MYKHPNRLLTKLVEDDAPRHWEALSHEIAPEKRVAGIGWLAVWFDAYRALLADEDADTVVVQDALPGMDKIYATFQSYVKKQLASPDKRVVKAALLGLRDPELLKRFLLVDFHYENDLILPVLSNLHDKDVLRDVYFASTNEAVREAIWEDTVDAELLMKIAHRSYDVHAEEALERLRELKVTDVELLMQIARKLGIHALGTKHMRYLPQHLLCEVLRGHPDEDTRKQAAYWIEDQAFMRQWVFQETQPGNRAVLAEKIDDPEVLKKIALVDEDDIARITAVEALADMNVLKEVIRQTDSDSVRAFAINMLLEKEFDTYGYKPSGA